MVQRQPAWYSERTNASSSGPAMPAKRTDLAAALAEKLVHALHAQGRPGSDAFPLTLQQLAQLADATAEPKTILAAASPQRRAFGRHAVAARKDMHAPVALLEDVPQLAASPRLLAFALAACRTAGNHVFSAPDLKAKVTGKLQKPFQEAITRQVQEDTLPPDVGWLHIRNTKKLFAHKDLHTGRKVEAAPVASASPPVVRETPDFGRLFDEAFHRLDREKGSHNFVSLVPLRQTLSVPRESFDAGLRQLRLTGRYTLSAAEGRHGLSEEEREAGILEDGALLLYVSRRSP
jgi:hypothetical protein